MNKVCVIGSLNMDFVMKVKHIPAKGETILAKSFTKIPGGKGANQAVAAARCGSKVAMIGKVGTDDNGKLLKDKLKEDFINDDYVFEDKASNTGTAMIMVSDAGDNSIVVNSGANMELSENDLANALSVIKMSEVIISQFEIPQEIAVKAFSYARENNKLTILNPAPAKNISDELLKVTDILVPNETETELLTGIKINCIEDAAKAAELFINKGVKVVIITMGESGAALISEEYCELIPAFKVKAVDTTAAGDCFIGALSSKLDINNLNHEDLVEAIRFASKASSIAVQRKGAQPSIPYLEEII